MVKQGVGQSLGGGVRHEVVAGVVCKEVGVHETGHFTLEVGHLRGLEELRDGLTIH